MEIYAVKQLSDPDCRRARLIAKSVIEEVIQDAVDKESASIVSMCSDYSAPHNDVCAQIVDLDVMRKHSRALKLIEDSDHSEESV